jgi:nitronate monooxygenase
MRTRFTDLVGCELPIQLAAMGGGAGTTELAAAVETAGAFGMVSWITEPAPGACGMNYLMPFVPGPDAISEAAKSVRAVEFFYGDPAADLVGSAHAGGALAGWQVGSVAEAVAAAEAGCDYLVAQGIEAGGHVRGKQPLDEILAHVVDAVRIPVLAAGGVATAGRVLDLLRSGADGVRVGTRFLASPESGAHQEYIDRLLAATPEDTVLSEWFSEDWENAPHRVLRACEAAARRSGWRSTAPPRRGMGREEAGDMAMYAGTGVGEVRAVQPAAEIVADLVSLLP